MTTPRKTNTSAEVVINRVYDALDRFRDNLLMPHINNCGCGVCCAWRAVAVHVAGRKPRRTRKHA